MNTVLEVANVEKYYGNKGNLTKALDKISFQVEEGEFVGIMGASGSGKTTLLNCLSTIDRITSGKIVVDDVEIPPDESGGGFDGNVSDWDDETNVELPIG